MNGRSLIETLTLYGLSVGTRNAVLRELGLLCEYRGYALLDVISAEALAAMILADIRWVSNLGSTRVTELQRAVREWQSEL